MGDFSDKVFEQVRRIPQGKVSTYGQIARLIGSPRSARYVGWALRTNTQPVVVPCHRVVFKDGQLADGYAFGGGGVQHNLLLEEGVTFLDDTHVDMEACLWDPFSCEETSDDTEDSGQTYKTRPTDIDWTREIDD